MAAKKETLSVDTFIQSDAKSLTKIIESQENEGMQSLVGTLRMLVGNDSLEETLKWLAGDIREAPSAVKLVSSNVNEKINMLNILMMMQNIQRSSNIINYLKEAEEMMFNRQVLIDMDTLDTLKVYSQAQKSLSMIFEHSHRFLEQSKTVLDQTEEMSKVIELLLSLSPENYDFIKSLAKDPSILQKVANM